MSDLRKTFTHFLEEKLKCDGFKKFQKQLATDNNANVAKRVHVAFVQNGKGTDKTFEAIIDVSLRYNNIEPIIEKWKERELAEKTTNAATLGVEIGQLFNARQRRYPITDSEEAEKSALAAYSDLEQVGKPYFHACSNPREIIRRFSSDNFRDWHQTLSGIAFRLPLLLIATDQSNANNCFDQMQARLDQTNDYYAHHYPSFRNYILTCQQA